jgi:hypothetical protein
MADDGEHTASPITGTGLLAGSSRFFGKGRIIWAGYSSLK